MKDLEIVRLYRISCCFDVINRDTLRFSSCEDLGTFSARLPESKFLLKKCLTIVCNVYIIYQ